MVKIKDPIKYKIICILIGLCLSIIGLELILRLLGFGYSLFYRLPKDKGADYRIFCVGESTTFGIGTNNPIICNYPHQLEILLNNKFTNLNIQCFFSETIGSNTSEILINLPLYLKEHNPDLIIFMVGVNNWWNLNKSNILLFNKNDFISEASLKILVFLDQFRAYKLFKWLCYSNRLMAFKSNIYFEDESTIDEEHIRKRMNKAKN